jgi:hypothetical protein
MEALKSTLDKETMCKLQILLNNCDITIKDIIEMIEYKWGINDMIDYNTEENGTIETIYNRYDIELDSMMGRERYYSWDEIPKDYDYTKLPFK